MKRKQYLSLLASIFLVSPGVLFAGTVSLTSKLPGVGQLEAPGQITFYIYESENAEQAITSQTFISGEWQASSTGDGIDYQVQFTALEAASYEGLWYQASADGITYSERQQVRAGVSDMYITGQVETGVGVRFPGGGLQTEPGITSEADPNLAPHTADASAHHTRYGNAEAVTAILANDGPGTGLDADLLDGQHATAFATTGNLATHAADTAAHHSRYTDGESVAAILANDGPGSGLNADLLDGQQATAFAASSHHHDAAYVNVTGDTMTGPLTATNGTFQDIVSVRDDSGTETIRLEGDETGGGSSSVLEMSLSDGTLIFDMDTTLNEIAINNDSGTETVSIDGDSGQAGLLILRNSAGASKITLDADYLGDGRITTQELAITGGSDLSEQFDIETGTARVEPGMLVSIDPLNPGKLVLSRDAYDRKVAGIISGAGGVKPGMMMGQEGTIANGEYPVALTGRVYAMVDASAGPVQPGDLLTTSDVPGYAMKVTDHKRAAGSIIGKAMTPLKDGQGLVLVLVSLQ